MLPWPILEYQQKNATTTRAIATTTTSNQQEQHEIQCCLFTIDFVFKMCRMALKYEKNKQQKIKKTALNGNSALKQLQVHRWLSTRYEYTYQEFE